VVTTVATARLGPVPTALPSAQRSGVKPRAESARPRTASSVAAARSAGMPTKTGRRLVLHEGPGAHCHPVSNAASLTAWWKCNVPFAVARSLPLFSSDARVLQKTVSPLYCGIGRESARARGRGSARLRCQGFAATRLTRLVRRTGSSIKNKCVRRAPALQHLPSVLTSPSGCTFCRCAAFHSANHFSLSRSILRNTREVSLACVRFSS